MSGLLGSVAALLTVGPGYDLKRGRGELIEELAHPGRNLVERQVEGRESLADLQRPDRMERQDCRIFQVA